MPQIHVSDEDYAWLQSATGNFTEMGVVVQRSFQLYRLAREVAGDPASRSTHGPVVAPASQDPTFLGLAPPGTHLRLQGRTESQAVVTEDGVTIFHPGGAIHLPLFSGPLYLEVNYVAGALACRRVDGWHTLECLRSMGEGWRLMHTLHPASQPATEQP